MANQRISIRSISPLRQSGARNTLYLVPATEAADGDPYVFLYSDMGNSWPMMAHHNRYLRLGSVSTDAVGEAVEEVLQAYAAEIVDVAAKYCGTTWDGNNHKGSWDLPDDDTDSAIDGLQRSLDEARHYYPADSYYAAEKFDDVVERQGDEAELDRVAKYEVANANGPEVELDQDDVRSTLVWMARAWLKEHEDEDDNAKIRGVAEKWASA